MWSRVHWDATNERKIAEHDLTKEEVEQILFGEGTIWNVSRSSGRPIGIGVTSTGRLIAVPVDELNEDLVRPVTAYDAEDEP